MTYLAFFYIMLLTLLLPRWRRYSMTLCKNRRSHERSSLRQSVRCTKVEIAPTLEITDQFRSCLLLPRSWKKWCTLSCGTSWQAKTSSHQSNLPIVLTTRLRMRLCFAPVLATARWASALDRCDRVGLVFLDMSKAFDCVLHRTRLTDRMDIGLTGTVLKWFAC